MNPSDPNLPPPESGNAPSPENLSPAEPAPGSAPVAAPPAPQLPDDLRVAWTWMDVLIFLVFAFGMMAVLEYAMQTYLLTSGRVKFAELPAYITGNAVYVTVRQLIWFSVLLMFLYFTLRPRQPAPFWQMLGWRPRRFRGFPGGSGYVPFVIVGFALAILVAQVSSHFAPARPLPIQALFRDRQSAYLIGTMAVLVAPLFEETVFRGFLYPVFARSLGVAGGIGLTGLLFGIMHAQQLWGGWAQIGLLVFVGVVFTFARARTRSVIPCYFLHLGYNSILFVSLFLSPDFWKLPLVR